MNIVITNAVGTTCNGMPGPTTEMGSELLNILVDRPIPRWPVNVQDPSFEKTLKRSSTFR